MSCLVTENVQIINDSESLTLLGIRPSKLSMNLPLLLNFKADCLFRVTYPKFLRWFPLAERLLLDERLSVSRRC